MYSMCGFSPHPTFPRLASTEPIQLFYLLSHIDVDLLKHIGVYFLHRCIFATHLCIFCTCTGVYFVYCFKLIFIWIASTTHYHYQHTSLKTYITEHLPVVILSECFTLIFCVDIIIRNHFLATLDRHIKQVQDI